VGNIEEERLLHPFPPVFYPLGVARGAKPAGAARKHQETFRMAVRTADAGKPAAGIAAVQVALDHLLDDGPEEALILLKVALVLG